LDSMAQISGIIFLFVEIGFVFVVLSNNFTDEPNFILKNYFV